MVHKRVKEQKWRLKGDLQFVKEEWDKDQTIYYIYLVI